MKYRDFEKRLEQLGWNYIRQTGSHRIYKHTKFTFNISAPVRYKNMCVKMMNRILYEAEFGK